MTPMWQKVTAQQGSGQRNWRQLIVEFSSWVLLAILLVIGAVATPLFLRPSNLVDVLEQSAIIGVLSLGQFAVILTGGIDLSVGALLTLSGMVGALAMRHGIVAGVLASLVTCGGLGLVTGVIVVKGRLPPFIVTFAMMAIARGVALSLTSGAPINLPGPAHPFAIIGTGVYPQLIWAGVILITYIMLRRLPLGRHIYAVGGHIEAARVSGINTGAMLILVYTFSGLCAAIGGLIFMARSTVALPTAGVGYELQTIAAVVLGGTNLFGGEGNLAGAVIGVIILTMLTNILDLTGVNPFWDFFAIGLVLWLAVIFRSRMIRRR